MTHHDEPTTGQSTDVATLTKAERAALVEAADEDHWSGSNVNVRAAVERIVAARLAAVEAHLRSIRDDSSTPMHIAADLDQVLVEVLGVEGDRDE